MRELRTTNVLLKVASQLLSKRKEYLVLVVDRVLENLGYKFVACAIEALPLNI